MSAISRAKQPSVSRLGANGLIPVTFSRPNVGLNPTMPQKAAGRMIDPAVCVPNPSGTIQSATAAAEPLDDPPGVCSGLRGLAVGPGWENANSVVTVLPGISAPWARTSDTHAASATGTSFA